MLETDTKYNYIVRSIYKNNDVDVESEFNFSIDVKVYNKRISGYTIKLNGISSDCVDMSIDGDPIDERFRDFVNPNIARFIKIRYDRDCNIAGNLHSASGTNHILQLCLYLVKLFFPNITHFEFRDSSARKCSDLSIYTVNSNTYFIALFGTTWYEGLYGAYIRDIHNRNLYNKCIERLHDSALKSSMSFEQFAHMFTINVTGQSRLDFEHLKNIYGYSKNFREFFDAIKSAYKYNKRNNEDREKICELLSPWVDDFIKRVILHNEKGIDFFSLDWFIDSDKITKPTILNFEKNKKMVGSGRRVSNGIYMLISSSCHKFD
jgi:hypothetical protein